VPVRAQQLIQAFDGINENNFAQYTNYGTAALRAIETKRSDRIINDPYVDVLSGETGEALVEFLFPAGKPFAYNVRDMLPIRTRYIDEELEHRDPSIKQICFLAAGLDTRAHRLQFLQGTKVFELDSAGDRLEEKRRILKEVNAPTYPHVHEYIATNLAEASWTSELVRHGFDPLEPTFWVVEGLSMYLEEKDLRSMLTLINSVSAIGSRIWMGISGSKMVAPDGCGMKSMVYGEDDPLNGVLRSLRWDLKIQAILDNTEEHFGRLWKQCVSCLDGKSMPYIFLTATKV